MRRHFFFVHFLPILMILSPFEGVKAVSPPPGCITNASAVTVPALARQDFRGTFVFEQYLARSGENNAYSQRYSASGVVPGDVLLLSYVVDGLRQYARLDLPTERTETPLPVLVYAHGWVGVDAAPAFSLGYDTRSMSGEFISHWVQQGYVVLSPGFRGHGTFANQPADGIEWLERWDATGSYLTPTFYALDLLTAIGSLPSLEALEQLSVALDLDAIVVLGHSQGGDTVLTTLAIDAHTDRPGPAIAAASIWSGCIGERTEQLELYQPMSRTLRAFTAGDGAWRASPRGNDGQINAQFLFPWPQDWVRMQTVTDGTWRPSKGQFTDEPVDTVITQAYGRVSEAFAACGIYGDGRDLMAHVEGGSGRHYAGKIQTPLQLHASDQDYYSPPAWNQSLADSIVKAGGQATVIIHPSTNHALKPSEQEWFSPPGTANGLRQAVISDAEFFRRALAARRRSKRDCDTYQLPQQGCSK